MSHVDGKRNLVVLGRPGVGKSSVVKQIVDKELFPISSPHKSATREHRDLYEATTADEGKVAYKVKIIDTAGLYNKMVDKKSIMTSIEQYSKTEAPEGINLILFIIRKDVLFIEDIKVFDKVFRYFQTQISDISALVVTGCEALSEQGKSDLVEKIKIDKETAEFAGFMGKGVFTVGFPDSSKLKPAIKEFYKEGIKSDAKDLRELVMKSSEIKLTEKIIEKKMEANKSQQASLNTD